MEQEQNTTRLVYDGKGGQLYKIWIINLLLKMVTLGIYSFWGKTRLRKYIVNSFSLLGDRFEYTGTGGELFRGFLKALPIIIILYAPFIIFPPEKHPATQLMFLPIFFLISAAIYESLRYKFSRTTWRGIRWHLTGSAFQYALLKMRRGLLNGITLGIIIPYSDIKTQKYIIDHTHFGSAKAEFNGDASKLMGINILTLLLAIPTLFFSRFWYRAALMRHVLESTTIGSLSFKGTQTGGNLLGLFLVNFLLLFLTLGFGFPLIVQRIMNYFADNVTIIGDMATSGIYQSDEVLGDSGEGIYGILGEQDIGIL